MPVRESAGITSRLVDTYSYKDAQGKLLFQVLRFAPKRFSQRKPDGNGWSFDLSGVPRVLYRLPELLAAPARRVLVVEGEKDVDRLGALGFVATCNPGGAGKWRPEFSEALRGRHVIILPDNDAPGRTHADLVARSLNGLSASVHVLQLPGLPPKGDVSDWLNSGGTVEELKRLSREAPEWTASVSSDQVGGFVLTSLTDLLNEAEESVAWIVEGMLPEGGVSVLVAKPKVGKSTLARQLAVAVARGEPFLGRETTKGLVIYLALEEKRGEVRAHFRAMGVSGEEIHIHFGSAPENAVAELRRLTELKRPVLVIVDPLFRMARVKDANDYAQVLAALEPFLTLARETGAHVLVVHHAGKSERPGGDSILGSTAILGTVDTAILMKRGNRYRSMWTLQRYGTDLEETVLDFDAETRTVDLGKSREEADEHRIAEEIEEFLRKKDTPATEEEIRYEVEGNTGAKAKALRRLVAAGKLDRCGEGKKGDPFTYLLSRFLVPLICRERGNENPKSIETPLQHWPDSRSQEGAAPEVGGNEKELIPSVGVVAAVTESR